MIYIIGGVSGSGKTTLGKVLAEYLGAPFCDADDFHPQSNIDKMHTGIALNDEDRLPWLYTLADKIAGWEQKGDVVLACSALKESYRLILSADRTYPVKWIFLIGDTTMLVKRLAVRKGHFFNPALLNSQLDTLELPSYALQLPADKSTEQQLALIKSALLL